MSKSIAVRFRNKSKANIWLDGVKNVLVLLSLRIKRQTYFVYGVFFIVSFLLVILFNKFFLHLKINQFHTSFLDAFFKYSTFLGDGVMFGVLVLLFVFVKRRIALVFLISGLLTLLVTHFFKKIIFKGIPRPVGVFGEDSLYLVNGVKMALWNSFPSGHTTTAFAIFTILCLYFAKCKSQYLWISLAIIAGLSRVYLSQHFLIDVFVGSFIGIVIGFISMGLFYKYERSI
ncbi:MULTISPECIES: phosphatase PAP2 family protein [Tenacibaculum]|uniref:phosphatase PAP2 family protein n=1 Tax=Tenacibaculum TaxID=104267 RepID=UPI00089542BA|nr:phosphatase PAP2 family protein [Tenacibaculum sp. MAR_2010_89]SEE65415.1 PAP2 superfamily protein [Tenacibaculum sp. MAR_2010_89]